MQLLGNGEPNEETAVSPTTIPAIAANTTAPTATTAPTETATTPPTATAAPTETAVPTNTLATTELSPSATSLPQNIAVATENASLFAQADAASSELAIVRAEDEVTVIGRSDNNNWLYVQDANGNRGFIFHDLLTWQGEIASLPVRISNATTTEATAVPTTNGTLSLDIYQLDGTETCRPGGAWSQQVYMRAQGVSGTFDYYWEDELMGTAVNDNITFEVSSGGGAIVGTGRVISNGIEASQQIFIPSPPCSEE
ncbi:MAG: SH3 domain-containing protein [Chloroflexota bacterium]